ncbi:MAG TPA: CRTAC1 family protein [Gemmataceae bacterium]|nr:CRTAC1 family protein [Gemmataceae bacterium]
MNAARRKWKKWLLPGALLAGGMAGFVACRLGNGPGAAPPPPEPPIFREIDPAESGVNYTYHNGQFDPQGKLSNMYSILESLGGGLGLIDFDGDGLYDLFVCGGGYFEEAVDPVFRAKTFEEWQEAVNKAKAEKRSLRFPMIYGLPCKLYKNLGNFKFQDVTKEAGLDKINFYNHGCAVADYDRDGWPDLLVTGYGRVALFHNEPVDPKDPKKGRKFREVTVEAKLLPPNHEELTRLAYAQGKVPAHHFWSTSAAWADLDGDGYPDLYLCQYVNWSFANHPFCKGYTTDVTHDVCPPKMFDAVQHAVWHNHGDGTFKNVSKPAGLRMPRTDEELDQLKHLGPEGKRVLRNADKGEPSVVNDPAVRPEAGARAGLRGHGKEYGKGLGVIILDIDGDGRPDIWVANDTVDNFMYLNYSRKREILLEEVGMAIGVAVDGNGAANGSMGVAAGDLDRSGWPWIFVTNYEDENHALYRNVVNPKGQHKFQFATTSSGMRAAFEQMYVGFGTAFIDLDNDGWEDIHITNGHVIRYPVRDKKNLGDVRQPPILLKNQGLPLPKGQPQLINISARGGSYFQSLHCGRGVAFGDIDNDGRIDMAVTHQNEPVAILRNECDSGNHWLGIELVGKKYRDVVGARLILEVDGHKQTAFMLGGGSYMAANDPRRVFGLGQATKIDKLTVEWPWGGGKQTWENLAIDRYHKLVEGEKEPRPTTGAR